MPRSSRSADCSVIERSRSWTPRPGRFRPNIVVSTGLDQQRFVENEWIDRTVAIGDEVRLRISEPCPRCVMTTLAQSDLPRDPGILRTAAQHNQANVGVYADVLAGGVIRRGDRVALV
jgi:uncharacterized protein